MTGTEHNDLGSLFEPYLWAWFVDTFREPSPPQVASWPKIAEGENTLILAPTGSGKTLASFLWCINDLFRMGSQGVLEESIYVLYISPLKALNNDIQKNLVEPLQGIQRHAREAGMEVPEVRSAVRTGDTTQRERARMARHPPHILITTPESLFIILSTAKFREALRTIRYVIVDEIHAMSDNKRGVHLSLSLERLAHLVQSRDPMDSSGNDKIGAEAFVRIGLSATQKPLDRIAGFLAGLDGSGFPRPCAIVDVGARKNLDVKVVSPVDNLSEAHYDAIWGSMYDKMLSMVRSHETTLVFANSRYKTERTALRLNELSADDQVAVGSHHGSMSKEVRLEMENRLKQGDLDALVATSSLELGIDVGSIDLVCQIQSPKSVSKGMQRVGRAGHLLNATSKGRMLVTDRDDLVESAVLVKAITEGEVDTTRVPMNCLDVLAQHVVGAVAAEPWNAEALYTLCRQSYCYGDLSRVAYERVLDMLSANDRLDMERPPYPKITWDKVNQVLYPERSARLIAFRSSGTIPDIEDYEVYLEKRKTRVGKLDEGFGERLHVGDVFVLGSSSWRVLGFRRNRVLVEDVYGLAPTIPYWGGDRDSRTYDLGVLVGQFRREMQDREAGPELEDWLQRSYCVDADGAQAIGEYFWEQRSVTEDLPSDRRVLVERFRDELGVQRIILHSSFGIRVHDAWAMSLSQAIEERFGFCPQTATVDDGILVTIPAESGAELDDPLGLVTVDNLDELMHRALADSPVFSSRFRHNAVRSFMVLREYRGKRTPVWLQGLRASALLEACRSDLTHPLMVETYRECTHEAVDVPDLRSVLQRMADGDIEVATIESAIPSPFAHSLLLLGQYGDMGSIPTRERRSRLMHLHRELLKQILDEETLRNLLDSAAVTDVETRLQHTHPERRARDANELARLLIELGDLVAEIDDEISLRARIAVDDLDVLLDALVDDRRAVQVPLLTTESTPVRWIATENLVLYRDAFANVVELDETDRQLLARLAQEEPVLHGRIATNREIEGRLERLVRAYHVLCLERRGETVYVGTRSWVPAHILDASVSRMEARRELVARYLRCHGPVTKYEVMERYGLPESQVETILDALVQEGNVVRGEYVPTKALPQWCYRGNLERIHSLTLQRLRKEMEPATPAEYADHLVRWQHVHPSTRLSDLAGLRQVLQQLQGQENYQIVYERDVFGQRIKDYTPAMLDRLCYGGEVLWRRLNHRQLRRGQFAFCFRRDSTWLAADPHSVEMALKQWDDDIPDECDAVREYLQDRGACFFDDIVQDTDLDWRFVLRAIWHLVWTGEVTNDSYESVRHANVASGLSGCYDLANRPGKKGVTMDMIVRHMLDNRRLDPRLGRWSPTERLLLPDPDSYDRDAAMASWAGQFLQRYGIISREVLKRETAAPAWRDLRRALIRFELLGQVRRGFFVEGLSGEQYGLPEAVDALRESKLRSNTEGAAGHVADDDIVLLNMCDPANPFSFLFPLVDEASERVKLMRTPTKYLVLAQGHPVLLYEGRIRLLTDMTRHELEIAIGQLKSRLVESTLPGRRDELSVREWNGHPIDVSPARHLLTTLGFVPVDNRWRGYVYDGVSVPAAQTIAEAEAQVPETFAYAGKEKAPVVYDAAWVVSRSTPKIQPKVQEVITWFQNHLPAACTFLYHSHYGSDFVIEYRGVRCIRPHIQRKKINLHITHRGWVPPIEVFPETDLDNPEVSARILSQFERSRAAIDEILEKRGIGEKRGTQ